MACAEAAASRLAITGSSLCFEAFGEATSLQDPRLLKPLPENTILLETPDPKFNVHLQSIFLPGVPSLVVNIDLGGVGVYSKRWSPQASSPSQFAFALFLPFTIRWSIYSMGLEPDIGAPFKAENQRRKR